MYGWFGNGYMMSSRSRKSFIIIDFQWYRYNTHSIVPKELATCDSDFKRTHFVFKPVLSFASLKEEDKSVARYVYNSHHGLGWDEGYICVSQFDVIIKRLCANVDVVYVKGKEKLEFLKSILNKRIVDLIDADKIIKEEPSCSFHVGNDVVCALTNVERLHKYLMWKVLRENNFNNSRFR